MIIKAHDMYLVMTCTAGIYEKVFIKKRVSPQNL